MKIGPVTNPRSVSVRILYVTDTSETTTGRSRRRLLPLGALSGVLAGGLTLGVAELVASVVNPASAPVLAVGDAFVDLTPAPLKEFAIENFGTNDKLVLLAGMGVVITLLAAAAGVVAQRSLRIGSAMVLALGLVAGVAAITRPGSGALSLLPTLVGTAAGLYALSALTRSTLALRNDTERDGAPRRTFLLAAGATGAVAAVAGAGGQILGRRTRDVEASRASIELPSATDEMVPVPDAATLEDVEGITPFQTPNEDFYRIDTALSVPRIPADTWSLRVHGMVENEIEMDFPGLLSRDLVERMITLTCVSNPVGGDLAGNAVWLGYPLKALLEEAVPTGDADMVLSTSSDGFTAGTPLSALTDGRDALLAISMNGEPLPPEHGFPVRMVVPGLYGYVSATKWVVDIELTRFDQASAYWTDRGWAEKGPIKIASRFDVPTSFAKLPADEVVTVAGVAWAQQRGISAVEVRVDGGEWMQATLAEEYSIDTWRQWVLQWDTSDVGPGNHTLQVRAIDSAGEVQTQERVAPIPDGASGWDSLVVQVG